MSRATGLTPDPGTWQRAFDAVETRLGADQARLRAEGERLSQGEAVAVARAVLSRAGPGVDPVGVPVPTD